MAGKVVKGDLFDPTFCFDAIGHGVNTQGKMGAGIAKAFAVKFPDMYNHYKTLCSYQLLEPGDTFYWPGAPGVFNIASQRLTGPDASLLWLGQGLYKSLEHMSAIGSTSLGLPWIGCGIGGLAQGDALAVIKEISSLFPLIDITIVEL